MKRLSSARSLMAAAWTAAAILLGCADATSTVWADDGWGNVTGQFVLDGIPPNLPPKAVARAAAVAVCGPMVPDEDLVVDPATKGIENIFVYMPKATTIHPDLKASEKKTVLFDQVGCRFVPHALFVRTDQAVVMLSGDPIVHDNHTFPLRNAPVNKLLKPLDRVGIQVEYKEPESLPLQVKCDLHPWMKAHWLVLDHPYAAITDAQGKFRIQDLPAGENEFAVWHEGGGFIERKLKVNIQPGQTTDLGVIKVPLAKVRP